MRGRLLVGVAGALAVTLMSGARAVGQCMPLWEERLSHLGSWNLESLEDVDGDGVRDFVTGSPVSYGEGMDVWSGATQSWLYELSLDDASDFSTKGRAQLSRPAAVGDVDGDGIADILVGIAFSEQEQTGEAAIFSGDDGEVLRVFAGGQADDLFGRAVTAVGDVDGDWAVDYAVAAPAHDIGELANIGRVVLYSGASGAALHGWYGTERGERFGSALAGGFDWNGDGVADVAVGSPAASGGAGLHAGRVSIYSGADYALLASLEGMEALVSFGAQIGALAPDDAFAAGRLLVSAPGSGAAGDLPGRVAVYDVSTQNLLVELTGDAAGDRFGLAVAEAGDVDGDGVGDIIVGSAAGKTGIYHSGWVWIVSGADARLLRRIGGAPYGLGERFGCSVEGMSVDLSSDGRDDVLVGQARGGDSLGDPPDTARLYLFDVARILAGDVNRDGHIDQGDLGILLATYELPPDDPQFSPEADVNGDGLVNQQDLGILLSQYGQGCD